MVVVVVVVGAAAAAAAAAVVVVGGWLLIVGCWLLVVVCCLLSFDRLVAGTKTATGKGPRKQGPPVEEEWRPPRLLPRPQPLGQGIGVFGSRTNHEHIPFKVHLQR